MRNDTGASRRSLLSAGAGAAAFSILRPEVVRGSSERLRAGIVGCGGRGTAAVHDLLSGNKS